MISPPVRTTSLASQPTRALRSADLCSVRMARGPSAFGFSDRRHTVHAAGALVFDARADNPVQERQLGLSAGTALVAGHPPAFRTVEEVGWRKSNR